MKGGKVEGGFSDCMPVGINTKLWRYCIVAAISIAGYCQDFKQNLDLSKIIQSNRLVEFLLRNLMFSLHFDAVR